jgi:hypothetical protein
MVISRAIINADAAAQFGFAARGQYAGEADGNGLIEGNHGNAEGQNYGWISIRRDGCGLGGGLE